MDISTENGLFPLKMDYFHWEEIISTENGLFSQTGATFCKIMQNPAKWHKLGKTGKNLEKSSKIVWTLEKSDKIMQSLAKVCKIWQSLEKAGKFSKFSQNWNK